MAPYRTRVTAIAAKIETVSGTDSVPTLALNAVRFVGNPVLATNFLEAGLRDDVVIGGMGSAARAAPAGRWGAITIRMEARGTGTTYAAGASRPETDPFIRAMGFAPTNTAGTWVYDPLDDGFETLTLYMWKYQKLYKMVGCVVAGKLVMVTNERAFWEFTVTGVMTSDPAQTVLGAITANNTLPPLFANSAVVVGANNYAGGYLVRRLEMDWPATLATRAAAGAPDGIVGYAITDRRARMTHEIEQLSLATFDPYALAKQAGSGGTATNGSMVLGATAFNTITLAWGQWALEIPGEGDNSGLGTYTLAGTIVAGSLGANGKDTQIIYS
jgi:hypothetical protein